MRVGLLVGVFSNSYSISVQKGILEELKSRNAQLVVFEGYSFEKNTVDDYAGNVLFNLLNKERLDGLIILSTSFYPNVKKELLEDLTQRINIPVVSLGFKLDGITSVVLDNMSGFSKVVDHLISHSYHNLALISGPLNNPESIDRRNGFLETLRKNGLEVHEDYLLEGTFGYLSGYNNARKLIPAIKQKAIDAVACANDEMALAAMRCFSENGINIPDDLAVTGFDDTGLSVFFSPPVTTVNQRYDLIAKKAVGALLEHIFGKKKVQTFTLEPELVIRKSCGCKVNCDTGTESFFQFIRSFRLNGRLLNLSINDFYTFMNGYLSTYNIPNCFIITYPEPLSFAEAMESKSALKVNVFYAHSQDKQIFYPKAYPLADILPSQLLNQINEPMLAKPLFFGKNQFGFLFISAKYDMAHLIEDLGLELCNYLESLDMIRERELVDKRLAEAHESLMISNKKLNQLTVKENLDKLSNIRYLAANMMQRRKGSPGQYALILVEIDNYHDVCSLFGFGEGEFVISSVSNILSNCIRDDDFLSHQSCERYIILVKNIQSDPIKAFEERFVKKLEEANELSQKPYKISFSWGSAFACVDQDFDNVYRAAEENLEQLKQQKRHIVG